MTLLYIVLIAFLIGSAAVTVAKMDTGGRR